ncbi:MAG: DUF3313 family protein [Gammaproteobacteria bacterium]
MRKTLTVILALSSLSFASIGAQADEEGTSFDGLVRVEDAAVGVAYIDPDADFSAFQRVAILEPFVSFRSNWQRDQNRGRRSSRVSASDMERIKADVAHLFKQVFTERLEADGGFEIVNGANTDVLLLRPAIIDLDITAPDTQRGGRSRTYAASSGAATLYIELFDSLSGQIIGRAIDRQAVRRAGGRVSWSSRVTNTADARRIFGGWADTLRGFLDQHYTPEPQD